MAAGTWTESDLTAIEAALKNGVRKVRYQTHEVEYQSIADMLILRDQMKAEIAAAAGTGGAVVFAARIP